MAKSVKIAAFGGTDAERAANSKEFEGVFSDVDASLSRLADTERKGLFGPNGKGAEVPTYGYQPGQGAGGVGGGGTFTMAPVTINVEGAKNPKATAHEVTKALERHTAKANAHAQEANWSGAAEVGE